jgi:hypothetical protein
MRGTIPEEVVADVIEAAAATPVTLPIAGSGTPYPFGVLQKAAA